jgi:hypothetical protein
MDWSFVGPLKIMLPNCDNGKEEISEEEVEQGKVAPLPYPQGMHPKTPQWTPKASDNTKPYVCYAFPIHSYL